MIFLGYVGCVAMFVVVGLLALYFDYTLSKVKKQSKTNKSKKDKVKSFRARIAEAKLEKERIAKATTAKAKMDWVTEVKAKIAKAKLDKKYKDSYRLKWIGFRCILCISFVFLFIGFVNSITILMNRKLIH